MSKSALIKLRFIGENLENNSLPIYELGNSFISLQRIINKSYLFHERRLKKGETLTKEERERIALQVILHTKESDGYILSTILENPIISGALGTIIATAFIALAKYAYNKLNNYRSNPSLDLPITVSDDAPLVASIYNDVKIITDRIENIGGTKIIEITNNMNISETIRFDHITRDYIRSIQNEPLLGDVTEVTGEVSRLYPRSNCIDINDRQNHYIKVNLSEINFNQIRYCKKKKPIVRIIGRPIYKLGIITNTFEEFEAFELKIQRNKSN